MIFGDIDFFITEKGLPIETVYGLDNSDKGYKLKHERDGFILTNIRKQFTGIVYTWKRIIKNENGSIRKKHINLDDLEIKSRSNQKKFRVGNED
jgi:hypothetical protein